MVKMEGRLLKLGTTDICGRMFSKDCKISFPNKVPITINFKNDPDKIVGHGEIIKDDKGLKVLATLVCDEFNDPEYYVGGFYTNVKSHDEQSMHIIDECKLVSMAVVAAPADKDLVIRRVENCER